MREIEATEIVAKYAEGGPSEVFDIVRVLRTGERVKSKIRVQFLQSEESIQALIAAQKSAKLMGETGDYGDIYREAQAHEVLARAVRATEEHELPDGTKFYPPLCVSADHLRRSFNEAELAQFLNCYQIVKSKFGPIETLEKEDAETWIARLSDPLRGPFFLSQLDLLHWPGLIALLAGMCRDLYQAAGLELPSLEPTLESTPVASTSDTGSSTEQLSASSTSDPGLSVPSGKTLTKDEAAALVKARKRTPKS
jgi:hypothetical protein